jgi:MFS family permease
MAFIDSTVINVAMPAIQASFHATVVDVQWVIESYGLLLAALILVGGSLGDIFGRRRMFVVGVAIFAVASTCCGVALNIDQLIIARSVQGVGLRCWCQEALRSSVCPSTRRVGVRRSAHGRALRRSPQPLGQY